MTTPASFATVAFGEQDAHAAVGLLFTIGAYHPGKPVYVLTDVEGGAVLQAATLGYRYAPELHIRVFASEDEVDAPHLEVIRWAFSHEPLDVCFLECHTLLTDKFRIKFENEVMVRDASDHSVFWTRVPPVIDFLEAKVRRFEELRVAYAVDTFHQGVGLNAKLFEHESAKSDLDVSHDGRMTFRSNPLISVRANVSRPSSELEDAFVHWIHRALERARRTPTLLAIHRIARKGWAIQVPRTPLLEPFQFPDGYGLRNTVSQWTSRYGDVLEEMASDPHASFVEVGGHLILFDASNESIPQIRNERENRVVRSFARRVRKLGTTVLVGHGKPILGIDASIQSPRWMYWPVSVFGLEKFIEMNAMVPFEERHTEGLILTRGDRESQRRTVEWSEMLGWSIVYMSNSRGHERSEYAHYKFIGKARYAFIADTRGKSSALVEAMALGTVPVLVSTGTLANYVERLEPNVHVLVAETPYEARTVLSRMTEDAWQRMSDKCQRWYYRNAHSTNSLRATLDAAIIAARRG